MLYRILSVLISLGIGLTSCAPSAKLPVPLIIDADTANEIDDIFALARAVNAPELELIGVTAAQFHTSPLASANTAQESQVLNEQVMKLLQVKDLPLLIGSKEPLSQSVAKTSPASDFIVQQAKKYTPENPLHLVILGSCTNVASAILQDTTIVPNIKVHYLGFWHNPITNSYNKKEFNSGNDTLAVNYLLNKKDLDLSIMTATTSLYLQFSKEEVVANLQGKGPFADLLLDRWEAYERWWTTTDPSKMYWTMWDVALIEALAKPTLSTQNTYQTPEENTPRPITIHTAIEVEAMKKDYWAHFTSLINKE
ncbi:MAG: nucleoside hydrolase [Aureispira sp.]